jgi:hypothetical protein
VASLDQQQRGPEVIRSNREFTLALCFDVRKEMAEEMRKALRACEA